MNKTARRAHIDDYLKILRDVLDRAVAKMKSNKSWMYSSKRIGKIARSLFAATEDPLQRQVTGCATTQKAPCRPSRDG